MKRELSGYIGIVAVAAMLGLLFRDTAVGQAVGSVLPFAVLAGLGIVGLVKLDRVEKKLDELLKERTDKIE